MAHPLAADFLQGYLNTAFLADNAAIFHPLIFAAKTFVVFGRAKNPSTEKTITFWLECAVVDGFWFFNFTE